MNSLDNLATQANADFSAAEDAAALENAKAKYLGKTGQITELMKGLGKLAPDERKAQGAVINAIKGQIEELLNARRGQLANAQMQERLNAEAIDITLPGRGPGNALKKFFVLSVLMWPMARKLKQTGLILRH